MASNMGPRRSYEAGVPPGMMEGPHRAPSSPPDTPAPTKCWPRSAAHFSRRIVSVNRELPQSTMMSPSSMSAASCSMTASVEGPAWTIMMATRGARRDATKSSSVDAGTKVASSPCSAMSFSVRAGVLLKTAVA